MKSPAEIKERFRLVEKILDGMSEEDDEFEEFDSLLTALGWVLGMNYDLPEQNIWRSKDGDEDLTNEEVAAIPLEDGE